MKTILYLTFFSFWYSGHIGVIPYLVDKCDPAVKHENDETALYIAAHHDDPALVATLLKELGQRIDVNQPSCNEETALHVACKLHKCQLIVDLVSLDGILLLTLFKATPLEQTN